MSSNDLDEKINTLLENDDTENFYSLICEIIEENKEYTSDLNNNLNEVFKLISNDLNESNQEVKLPFICLFFEILIQENLDFSLYLEKTFQIINQNEIYSDENIKRIINICSNATIKKKDLFDSLISFSKNKIEYLYIIFSLAGFKDIILDNVSDNWELIIELLDNPEIKSNSNSIKSILKCLELLINLSAEKFRPFASSALYQALDYLTETDTELQKRSLMIIYSLTKYCDEQLQPLSENIVDFLKVLQNGNNIEINNLCNTMLKHFMGENIEEYENEENINENDNENNDGSNGNNNENEYENENENENYENNNKINENNDNFDENVQKGKNYQNSKKYEENNEEHNQDNKNENEEDEGEGEMEEEHMEIPKKYVKEERQEKDDEEEEQKYIPKYEKKENKYENEGVNRNKKYNFKDEDKNENDENNEENEINEEEEEHKYDYKKRNINNINTKEEGDNNERINKKDNIDNENNLNNIDINAIIKKIKDLSDKQIIILDSIEQYKRDTKRIINQKKLKIQSLEAKIEELQEKIRIEKNKKRNKPVKTNYQMKRKNNNNNDYDDEDEDNKYNYRY
jgi:hypothetical protein